MTSGMDQYRGEESLQHLLRNAPGAVPFSELKAMMPSILAAPGGDRAQDWIDLVAPKASPALRSQLIAYRKSVERQPAAPDFAKRLERLRHQMHQMGIDGFVIPRADEHQGEYVPKNAERLAYISNFTGSAGLAIILMERAAIFVDGRYTIQVRAEVDASLFDIRHVTKEPPEDWLRDFLKPGMKLAGDPKLLVSSQWKRFEEAARNSGAAFVPVEQNPLDAIWQDRPAPPIAPVHPHRENYAGKSSGEKRQQICTRLQKEMLDAMILSAPDSVNWLLNIRGGDIPRTPFSLGYAILHKDQHVDLFMDKRKFSPDALAHLGNQVSLHRPEDLQLHLQELGKKHAKIAIDPLTCSYWIKHQLEQSGAKILLEEDLCALPKAAKNAVEIEGTRNAHIRDGVAIVRFLHWLSLEAPKGHLTEISAAEKLAAFRRQNDLFRDFSFDTISAAGPNGAICHYRVTEASNRKIERDSLYLVDSGGQYLDGTTDITRTVVIGQASDEMRRNFTLVLKGHIALASACFPQGTTGHQLDALARMPLWQAGLDYDHGTGHGVGSYLSVHEGPQRISNAPNKVALLPGMILSNEPGYYKDGAYGIRIENLIVVKKKADAFLEFETITFAPIDRAVIEKELLTSGEKAWLNQYHERVWEKISPFLEAEVKAWLKEATRPI